MIHVVLWVLGRPMQDLCLMIDEQSCLQCFDAVGWAARRASGL